MINATLELHIFAINCTTHLKSNLVFALIGGRYSNTSHVK